MLRRIGYAANIAALVGLALGCLYTYEPESVAAECHITDTCPVDPGRPLPGWITDQYDNR